MPSNKITKIIDTYETAIRENRENRENRKNRNDSFYKLKMGIKLRFYINYEQTNNKN